MNNLLHMSITVIKNQKQFVGFQAKTWEETVKEHDY